MYDCARKSLDELHEADVGMTLDPVVCASKTY